MNTTDSAKVSDANAGANNVIHIPHNPTLTGLATLTRNVAYKTGADNLVMDIISPQSTGDDDDRRYPTVVFVQGSAWTTPHRDYEIPQLSALAREGFVVATVNHRDASSDPPRHVPRISRGRQSSHPLSQGKRTSMARGPRPSRYLGHVVRRQHVAAGGVDRRRSAV